MPGSEAIPITFTFNGTFAASDTLGFSVTRNYATVHPGGDRDANGGGGVAINAARYWHSPRLLCGAPVVRTDVIASFSSGHQQTLLAGGLDSNSTTWLLLYFQDHNESLKLRLLNSDGSFSSTEVTWNLGLTVNGVVKRTLLAQEQGAPTDRFYRDGWSFTICHGLIVAFCSVETTLNHFVTTAMCYLDRFLAGNHWKLLGEATPTQDGKQRGSRFMQSGYRVLPSGISGGTVLKAVFPSADYVTNYGPGDSNNSSTGLLTLCMGERDGVGGPRENLGKYITAFQVPDSVVSGVANSGQHVHTVTVEAFGQSGMRLIAAVGDALYRNRVLTLSRTDLAYNSGDGWTVVDDRHGSHLPQGGSTLDPVGEGNQFVGCAALGTPSSPKGHLAGADEMPVPIARLIMPSGDTANDKLNFTRVYGVPPCSFNRSFSGRSFGWNVFHIHATGAELGGPYAANITPNAQNGWETNAAAARIAFSKDGFTFGQCWAPGETDTNAPAILAAGRIFFGSNDGINLFGLRSIPFPASVAFKPLCVGSGGVNAMYNSSNALQLVYIAGTNEMTAPVLLTQSQIPAAAKPPCLGPVYKCVADAATSGKKRIGIWRLTADGEVVPTGTPANAKIKLKAWVYVLPYTPSATPGLLESKTANSMEVQVALGRVSPLQSAPNNTIPLTLASSREEVTFGSLQTVGDPGSVSNPPIENQRRGWVPVTLETSSSSWTDETGQGTPAPSSPFALGLRLAIGAANIGPNQFSFLIAFDSVIVGDTDYPDVPAPINQRFFEEEIATVSGFSCDTNWTIKLAGELSESGADQLIPPSHRTGTTTLATLWQSTTKYIEIKANFTGKSIDFVVKDGSTGPTTYSVTGKEDIITGNPDYHRVNDKFYFLRGSPILLAVTRSGSAYKFFASVGGTEVSFTTQSLTGVALQPTAIKFGNPVGASPESMYWYGGEVWAGTGESEAAVQLSLEGLTFLIEN